MSFRLRIPSISAGLLGGLLLVTPVAALERVSLQLRWDHQFQFAGYYAAQWLGFYREAGLEVEIRSAFPTPNRRLRAVAEVAEGRADFGVGAADILMKQAEGVPLVVLATLMQQSDAAYFSRSDTFLNAPSDMRALRVLVRRRGPADLELLTLLHRVGVKVGVAATAMGGPVTLLRRQADLVPGSLFDFPYVAETAGLAVRDWRPSRFGLHFCGDSLFTREDLLRDRPDQVLRFREASLRGWEYALHHPGEIADRISAELPRTLPVKNLRALNRYQIGVVEELTSYTLIRPGRITPEVWRKMGADMLTAGLISQLPRFDELLYDPVTWLQPWWRRHLQQLLLGLALAGIATLALLAWIGSLQRAVRRTRQAMLRLESRYRWLYQGNLVAIVDEDFTALLARLDGLRREGVTDLDDHLRQHPELLQEMVGLIRLNDVNAAGLELFEASSLQELEAGLERVFTPAAYELLLRSLVAIWERQTVFLAETRYRGLQGGEVHAIVSFPIPHAAVEAGSVPVSVVDITRRREAERELTRSQQRYRNLFRTAEIAIVEEDLSGLQQVFDQLRRQGVTDLTEHLDKRPGLVRQLLGQVRLNDANDAALRLLGATAVPGLQGQRSRLFLQDTLDSFGDMLLALWRGERAFITEAPGRSLDGRDVFLRLAVNFPEAGGDWRHVPFCLVDLTESRRREERLRQLSHAIEQTSAMVVITDADGVIEYVNPAFEQTTGYSLKEVVGQKPSLLRSGFTPDHIYRELWRTITAGEVWRGEFYNRKKNGDHYWEYATISPLKDSQGNTTRFVAVKEDISRIKEQETQLMLQAHYDDLTGLPNRSLALDRLEQAVRKAQRRQERVALMFVDLDNFKAINDSLGHDAGDALLVEAAARIKHAVRTVDTVGRFGGDEFVVVLEDIHGETDVEQVAHKVNQAFQLEFTIRGQEVATTGSIGIALMPENGLTAQELLKAADAAMYKAKEAGRNTFHFFTASMNVEVSERLMLESRLRHALARQDLYLEYQPLVRLRDGRCVGAEALLRWRDPELGLIAPSRFIPMAEGIGKILDIGAWVLQTACCQGREWLDRYGEPLHLAVNVSPRQIYNGDLVETVERALQESGLPASCLVIEVTEGLLIQDHRGIRECLAQLKAMGVQLSVDDFGTGYSALGYLKRFPFDILKIDRSFVGDLERSADSATLVRAIIAMARGLGLQVIGEGVESAGQSEFLRQSGCETVQGFHFSRPLSTAAFAAFLKQRRDGGTID